LEPTGTTCRFVTTDTTSKHYTNAQLDDYQHQLDCQGHTIGGRLHWHPPLRFTVRACFSHPDGELRGTAGFGFWNYPFLMPEPSIPSLPRALWFFYASAPSDMKLDMETAGYGWKTATIDTSHLKTILLAPCAPILVPLMNSRAIYQRIWPPLQRQFAIQERAIPSSTAMTTWHTYTIEWGAEHSHFFIDGEPHMTNASSPRGPLCCVMWLDNQYMVVTPWGKVRWGLLDTPSQQWMELEWVKIEPLASTNTSEHE
jgi:hypothetical protein